ncbi:DNA sulfur modification protein DndD [Vulgatibacter sp.]|uniref:DNA sulfur modification protein DndD n=1 Tax=Vulgatibacter sp. TaxID=1971226 RepID=UPI003565F710
MYLRKIRLLDWKLYGGEHTFDFPAPGKRRNVILVGAKNGYGKTSLLEAIALGLYGRDGLAIVARADSLGDDERRRQNYRKFIEGAWNDRARAEGRTSMAVELDFEDDTDGQSINIKRTWNFTVDGRLLGDGESVTIDHNGKRRMPGKLEDKDDFARGWIAKAALPAHLAEFFLFDGERVQNLARREMAIQVRHGIEGFLGVKVMRDLATDLRTYVGMKRSEVRGADSALLLSLQEEVEAIDSRLNELRELQLAAQERLRHAERECDELRGRMSGMSGGAVQSVKRLADEQNRIDRSLEKMMGDLTELLGGDFSLALAGTAVREALRNRLVAEQRLAKWESGLESSKGQVGRFLRAFAVAEPQFQPALSETQREVLERKAEAAWTAIWHPPADGCAEGYLHPSLSDLDRARVIENLDAVSKLGQESIGQLLHEMNGLRDEHEKLKNQINTYASFDSVIAELTSELDKAVGERSQADSEIRAIEREINGLDQARANKHAELQRERVHFAEAQPLIAKADLGEQIADMIGPFIEEAVGGCVDDIATRMTDAFAAMAHKSNIGRIEITRDCEVRLMPRNGTDDIRSLDQSAGENQIFAFSLISAIAQAAEVRFPLIIDTPLARLDAKHRENVLRHFSDRAGEQIILLSQDTEVVDAFKDAIGTRVAETFLIEHEGRSGSRAGRARVTRGKYF